MNATRAGQIGEPPSDWRRIGIPFASVMFASALPLMLPIIASSPVLPPFGLLLFLCWQLLRLELWPVWIGLPLGLWDDMLSGQPIGSAMCLWTLSSLVIHYFARRIYWRDFRYDWAIAALLIAAVQGLGGLLAHPHAPTARVLALVVPQVATATLLVPLAMRIVGWFDNFRLKRR